MILQTLNFKLKMHGLMTRGAFHPASDDVVPDDTGTLIMIGNAGPAMWKAFSANIPNDPHPLDSWTCQALEPVAEALKARVVFPFSGPPHHPFQRWAMRADPVSPSPIGPLIHPEYGMWHAYRGAFLFAERLDIPVPVPGPSPCESCPDKPCLNTCPVGAFTLKGYDVPACRNHIARPEGIDCLHFACQARRACPVGQDYIYEPDQARFHMQKFLDAGR